MVLWEKSCSVAEKCASSGWSVYYKPRGKCWDGSSGQDVTFTDDFSGEIPYDKMLHIVERHPEKVPIKSDLWSLTETEKKKKEKNKQTTLRDLGQGFNTHDLTALNRIISVALQRID